MRIVETRTLVAFVVGAGVAVACTVAGASFANQPAERAAAPPGKATAVHAAVAAPLITAACADKKTGAVTIKGKKHKKCTGKEKAIRFATQVTPTGSILQSDGSLQLAKGAKLTSPNGLYTFVVTDEGVGLKGPGGTMTITPFAASVNTKRTGP